MIPPITVHMLGRQAYVGLEPLNNESEIVYMRKSWRREESWASHVDGKQYGGNEANTFWVISGQDRIDSRPFTISSVANIQVNVCTHLYMCMYLSSQSGYEP